MANNFYGATSLTGGGTGALDKIDGSALVDLDAAFVVVLNKALLYHLDADSAAAEDSPNVIKPDTNAGDKRWILCGITIPSVNDATTPSLAFGDGNTGFYEDADNSVSFAGAGVQAWNITRDQIEGKGVSPSVALRRETSTATNPVYTFNNSFSLGLGQASITELSLIVGDLEGIRISEIDGKNYSGIAGSLVVGDQVPLGRWDGDGVSAGSTTITDVGGAAHGLTLAAGDFVYIANSSTAGDIGWYSIVSTDGTAVVLNRALSGSDADLTVIFFEDIVVIDSQRIILPTANTPAKPTLAFGDGDSGFYENVDDSIKLSLGGSDVMNWSGGTMQRPNGINMVTGNTGSVTTPNYSFFNDGNTGMYNVGAGSDILGLSAGGILGLSLTEIGDGVVPQWDVTAGITAYATGGQANAVQIISAVTEISVCATGGDSVKLPEVLVGSRIVIINNGAAACDVFPATDDDLGAGANTAISLGVGASVIYQAFDATTWKAISSVATTDVQRSVTVKLEAGGTPTTNINVTVQGGGVGYNIPSITDAVNLAKSGTEGSFSLNAGGTTLTMNLTEAIVGFRGACISIQDLNNSSTSEMYFVWSSVSAGNLTIALLKRGTGANTDLTSILLAGDKVDITLNFVTSS